MKRIVLVLLALLFSFCLGVLPLGGSAHADGPDIGSNNITPPVHLLPGGQSITAEYTGTGEDGMPEFNLGTVTYEYNRKTGGLQRIIHEGPNGQRAVIETQKPITDKKVSKFFKNTWNRIWKKKKGGGKSSKTGESVPFKTHEGPPVVHSLDSTSRITVPPREGWVVKDGLDPKDDEWLDTFRVREVHEVLRRTFYDDEYVNITASFIQIISPPETEWLNFGETCSLDSCESIHGYEQIEIEGLPKTVAATIGERLEVSFQMFTMEDGRILAQATCAVCREPKVEDGVAGRHTFLLSVVLEETQDKTIASLEQLVEDFVAQLPQGVMWVGGDVGLPEAYITSIRQDGEWMYIWARNTTNRVLKAHPWHFSSLGEVYEQPIEIPPGEYVFEFRWPTAEDGTPWTDSITILYVQNGKPTDREHWDGEKIYGNRLLAYFQRDLFCEGPEIILVHRVVPDDYWETALADCRSGKCSDDQPEYYYTTKSELRVLLKWMNMQQSDAILAFDDGSKDWVDTVLPALKEYERQAIFFVTTGSEIATPWFLQKLADSPYASVQSHTHTHPYLSKLTDEEIYRELKSSYDTIGWITGEYPVALALPYGDGGTGKDFERILKIAREVGYRFIRTSERGSWMGSRMDVTEVIVASSGIMKLDQPEGQQEETRAPARTLVHSLMSANVGTSKSTQQKYVRTSLVSGDGLIVAF